SGQRRKVTRDDRLSVDSFAWAPDGKTIYFEAQYDGGKRIWAISAGGGDVAWLTRDGVYSELAMAPDGRWIVCSHQMMVQPSEIVRVKIKAKSDQRLPDAVEQEPISRANDSLLSTLRLNKPEFAIVEGAGGA